MNTYGFRDFAGLQPIPPVVLGKRDKPKDKNVSEMLRTIFSVGTDGRIVNDVSYMINQQTDPRLRQFVETQLMQNYDSVSPASQGVPDDDIAEFTRQRGETQHEYVQRCCGIMERLRNERSLRKQKHANKTPASDVPKNE